MKRREIAKLDGSRLDRSGAPSCRETENGPPAITLRQPFVRMSGFGTFNEFGDGGIADADKVAEISREIAIFGVEATCASA